MTLEIAGVFRSIAQADPANAEPLPLWAQVLVWTVAGMVGLIVYWVISRALNPGKAVGIVRKRRSSGAGASAPHRKAAWKLLERGTFDSSHGRTEKALQSYDRAIELDPTFALAFVNRAVAKVALGRYDESFEDLDRAIALDPAETLAHHNRGFFRAQLGRNEEAIEDLNEAIRLDPGFGSSYGVRGVAKMNLARYEEALQDLDRAIQLTPKDPEARCNRGAVWMRLGRFDDARQDILKARKLAPRLAHTHFNLACLEGTQGNPQAAVASYRKAVGLDPEFRQPKYFDDTDFDPIRSSPEFTALVQELNSSKP